MTQETNRGNSKKSPLVLAIAVVLVLGVFLAASGFTFAATQETHDAFCASCHTQPESTFYQRSTGAQPVDLASLHKFQKGRCIDCHSGEGLSGRVSAELMGANNAFKWYTGTAIQPAVQIYPIGDQNCLKCHQDVTQPNFTPKEQITVPGRGGFEGGGREGRNNHWHTLLARWQSTSPTTAGTCISCHSGHNTGGTAQTGYMNSTIVQAQCEACHQVLRREGEGG
jgi:hypothetical protein